MQPRAGAREREKKNIFINIVILPQCVTLEFRLSGNRRGKDGRIRNVKLFNIPRHQSQGYIFRACFFVFAASNVLIIFKNFGTDGHVKCSCGLV